MQNSATYPNLQEPGLSNLKKKKKKKRMERGENSYYDADLAEASQNRADQVLLEMVGKQVGVQYPKRKK